jgi:enoyl-CoA hydratase/carnithine racemase
MKKIKVNYSHESSVASILLDDGKGNILDRIMMDELQYVFDSFTKKEELKLIVFEGAGTNFSFGASVEEHRKEHAAVMLRIFISCSIPSGIFLYLLWQKYRDNALGEVLNWR